MNLLKSSTLLIFLLFSLPVMAEEWSSTNVQLLYGNNFSYDASGDKIVDHTMRTVTIEHVGGWAYGENFFFVDMTSGDFASGKSHKIYGEWAPKLSLSKMSNTDLSYAFIKDIRLSGELNQGDNFQAVNLGVGLALDLPTFTFFDANFFVRNDNFNKSNYQLTLAWQSKFSVFDLPLIFEGFLDYYGVDYGTEVVSQPRLLLDGSYFTDNLKDLHAGVEFYCYKSSSTPWRSEVIKEYVPQIMIKWIW